jgi:hypothetical protein
MKKIKNQKVEDVKKRKKMTEYVEKMLGIESDKQDLYEEEIGVVGVDSGQLVITDPCYIDSQWKEEEFTGDGKAKYNFSYNACCQKTIGNENTGQLNFELGHAGVGVVVRTGYGDGVYPVIATIDKTSGRVKSIRVEFF